MAATNPPVLSAAVLDAYRAALRKAHAPLGDELTVGLSDESIDELLAAIEVTASPELRALWRWGCAPEHPSTREVWSLNPDYELYPPERAITETLTYRLAPDASATAVAFAGYDMQLLMIDTAAAVASPIELFFIDDPYPLRAAPSAGALIELWTKQLNAGDYWFADGQWEPDSYPQTLLLSPE